jgi:hypothetical protein
MKFLTATLFVLVGLINLYPVVGSVGSSQLETLYGIPFAGEDLLLLMRHRALLLGLLGAFIIGAAFHKTWRPAATVAGLVSMLAFVVLSLPLSEHGPALQRVVWADVIASVLLIAGYSAGIRKSKAPGIQQ